MRKKQKEIPGSVVKIDLNEKAHCYARVLNYGDLAFYDCLYPEQAIDMIQIINKPILFKAIVNEEGVKYGRWPIVGLLPLQNDLQDSKYYVPKVGHDDVYNVYHNGKVIINVPIAECIGLERGTIYDPESIEECLRNYYSIVYS